MSKEKYKDKVFEVGIGQVRRWVEDGTLFLGRDSDMLREGCWLMVYIESTFGRVTLPSVYAYVMGCMPHDLGIYEDSDVRRIMDEGRRDACEREVWHVVEDCGLRECCADSLDEIDRNLEALRQLREAGEAEDARDWQPLPSPDGVDVPLLLRMLSHRPDTYQVRYVADGDRNMLSFHAFSVAMHFADSCDEASVIPVWHGVRGFDKLVGDSVYDVYPF